MTKRFYLSEATPLIALALLLFAAFTVHAEAATTFSARNLTESSAATEGYTKFSEIRVNDRGQVAFIGRNATTNRSDVFFWDGAVVRSITKESPQFAGFSGSIYLRLNQSGQLAFVGYSVPGTATPFFYDGTSLRNLWPTGGGVVNSDAIALNDSGWVTFAGCFGKCGRILLFDGVGVNVICDAACGFGADVWQLSINARGHVAWGGAPYGVGFYDGSSVRDVTEDPVAKGSGFDFFGVVQLSDADQVAFIGRYRGARPAAVFYFDGASLRNVTTGDPGVGLAGFNEILAQLALSSSGHTAFTAYQSSVGGASSEMFYFDGGPLADVTASDPVAGGVGFSFFGGARLNSTGQLVFLGSTGAESSGSVFLFRPGAPLRNITPVGAIAKGESPRINDAGHVLFTARDSTTPTTRSVDLFFFDGTNSRNITGGDTALSDRIAFYLMAESVPSVQQYGQFSNRDQFVALGQRADGTDDVFLWGVEPDEPPAPCDPPRTVSVDNTEAFGAYEGIFARPKLNGDHLETVLQIRSNKLALRFLPDRELTLWLALKEIQREGRVTVTPNAKDKVGWRLASAGFLGPGLRASFLLSFCDRGAATFLYDFNDHRAMLLTLADTMAGLPAAGLEPSKLLQFLQDMSEISAVGDAVAHLADALAFAIAGNQFAALGEAAAAAGSLAILLTDAAQRHAVVVAYAKLGKKIGVKTLIKLVLAVPKGLADLTSDVVALNIAQGFSSEPIKIRVAAPF